MNRRRYHLIYIWLVVVIFTIAGCGGGDNSPADNETNSTDDGTDSTDDETSLTAPTNVSTGELNDTAITANQCYEAGNNTLVSCSSTGAIALNDSQDGMVGRDATTATNSSTDGKLGFSFTSVTDDCVLDNVTGLLWEIKATDDGLRDRNNTYTNYTPLDESYGTSTDASGFIDAVNASNLCGADDWRLPTAEELQSLVDYSVAFGAGATIDTTWFPVTHDDKFWSASSNASNSSLAWEVDFANGSIHSLGRGFPMFVRLVRAGPPAIPAGYTVSADGQEVTDNQTNLIWRRCAEDMSWDTDTDTCTGVAGTYTQEAALQLAASEADDTGVAWRLPNIKELASIVDRSLSSPAIDIAAFPATPSSLFWSASPASVDPSLSLHVDFDDGYAGYGFVNQIDRGTPYYVRLVRSGE